LITVRENYDNIIVEMLASGYSVKEVKSQYYLSDEIIQEVLVKIGQKARELASKIKMKLEDAGKTLKDMKNFLYFLAGMYLKVKGTTGNKLLDLKAAMLKINKDNKWAPILAVVCLGIGSIEMISHGMIPASPSIAQMAQMIERLSPIDLEIIHMALEIIATKVGYVFPAVLADSLYIY